MTTSIFSELYAMTGSTTFVMVVSSDHAKELLTINVIPKPKDAKDGGALAEPLALTASVADMEAGFIDALAGYKAQRQSIAEQVAANSARLKAASAKADAGAKPAAKGAKARPAPSGDDQDTDDDHGGGTVGDGDPPPPPAPPAPPAAPVQPNLFADH